MSLSESYAGINYDHRPVSFWEPELNPLAAVTHNVKGQQRRALIQEHALAGTLDTLPDYLLSESLNDEVRKQRGQIHPMFMGGEYLPDYKHREVEIARIELQSTTYDVISLRARPSGSRIRYTMVDEYGNDFEYKLPQHTSRRPFSLRELIQFLDSTEQLGSEPKWNRFGFIVSFNECTLDCGADLKSCSDFTRVVSDVYPDLWSHYRKVLEGWFKARMAEYGSED